jgi:hypothetical protein
MPVENSRFEKLMSFIILTSLIALFAFKKVPLRQTFNILLAASIIANMVSKTIRFWLLLPQGLKALWIISIMFAVAGAGLFMVMLQGKWSTLFVLGVFVHTFSAIMFYKKLKKEAGS